MKKEKDQDDWRIKFIPFTQKKLNFVEPNWGAIAGAVIFVGGIVLAFYFKPPPFSKRPEGWIVVSAAGLLFGFLSLLLKGRKVRRNWIRVQAKCLDREIRKMHTLDADSGKAWFFQLLCEFELDGRAYQVTPSFWRSFATKMGITNFLARNISPEGICELYVNPDNPLQTEFVGRDLKDILLH